MSKVLFLFVLIFTIKCEGWWDEVKGHSIGDYDDGYAGDEKYKANDFYLCSERKYRVHYLNDDKDKWSEEFSACQPAGICRFIDGLAIDGGKPYTCRTGDDWPEIFTFDYNISNSSGGYSGNITGKITGILVYGNEYYRNSDDHNNYLCSYEPEVANRVINNLFENNLTFNYDNETKMELKNNENINVSVILLKPHNIKMKGKISIRIIKSKIEKNKYRGIITDNYIDIINEIIDCDFNEIKTVFENQFTKGMYNGDIEINFDWINKTIIIEVGSKIDQEHFCYRGGFRINIYLNEEDYDLIEKIKKICKFILRYSGKIISNNIRDLLSQFNSFEKVEEVLNYLDTYSNIAEEIILFAILRKILYIE